MKKIGIEIEFTGITRSQVVTALENFFQVTAASIQSKTADDGYYYHKLIDNNGDTWLVVRDRSIKAEQYAHKVNLDAEDKFELVPIDGDETEYMVELVTPALTSTTLPTLFTIVDIIKALGGVVNSSCGLHIHLDKPDSLDDILTLYNRFYNEQEFIFTKFNVAACRLNRYCKCYNSFEKFPLSFNTEDEFINYLVTKYADTDEFNNLVPRSIRYYALNFWSLKEHGTIEFRLFNSTLDRVEIARIIDWVIHFVYTAEDYTDYISILGNITASELK